jgi:hypothetical protein
MCGEMNNQLSGQNLNAGFYETDLFLPFRNFRNHETDPFCQSGISGIMKQTCFAIPGFPES